MITQWMLHYPLRINVLGLDNIRGVHSPLIFFLEVYMSIKKLIDNLTILDFVSKMLLSILIFLIVVVIPYLIYDTSKTYTNMREYAQVQLSQDLPSDTMIVINIPSIHTEDLTTIIDHGFIIVSITKNTDNTFYITCKKR